jgi:DNA-binding NarL/FixJ family response regulator
VDDHRILRQTVRAVIEQNGFEVVAEVGTGPEAIRVYKESGPAIVIMDLNLPGGLNGVDTTVEIRRYDPDAKILVLSMHDDEATVVDCLRAGARGFVLKDASVEDLIDAVGQVSQGGICLSPKMTSAVLSTFTQRRGEPREPDDTGAKLSLREDQILRLIASGSSNKDIALLLELSVETVRSYRKSLMKKLGAKNVAGLVNVAVRSGMMNTDGQRLSSSPPA